MLVFILYLYSAEIHLQLQLLALIHFNDISLGQPQQNHKSYIYLQCCFASLGIHCSFVFSRWNVTSFTWGQWAFFPTCPNGTTPLPYYINLGYPLALTSWFSVAPHCYACTMMRNQLVIGILGPLQFFLESTQGNLDRFRGCQRYTGRELCVSVVKAIPPPTLMELYHSSCAEPSLHIAKC